MTPDKLINYMCYLEGNKLVGTTDVTMPDISFMSETLKGAGIAGEIDSPTIGHTQSMSVSINWRSLIDDNVSFAAPKTYLLDFRGSQQVYDESSGEYVSKALKLVMKCIPKAVGLGTLDTSVTVGTSTEFEVVYLKLSLEGIEKVEIDKINFIYSVNGVDYLQKVRTDLGM